MNKGRVLKQQKGLYTIETKDKKITTGYASSKLRKDGIRVLAGDNVVFVENDDGTIYITDVVDRRNTFLRPPVANIDTLVLVVAAAQPQPDTYNIDCILAIADASSVKPIIVVTKIDLAEYANLSKIYQEIGYEVFEVNALKDYNKELYESLDGICVFTGQSGVGKSTLINSLFPHLELEMGELSERLGRGKNTTRHTELFPMGEGLYLADTPGFSSLDFLNFDILELEDFEEYSFPEFSELKGNCKFRGCTHLREEGCEVIVAAESDAVKMSRYESYKKLKNELMLKEERKYER